MVVFSADVPPAFRGGLKEMLPLILLQVTVPAPAGLDLAALAEPTPTRATAETGSKSAPVASMSLRVNFTCPP
jgi:hypothetical protein